MQETGTPNQQGKERHTNTQGYAKTEIRMDIVQRIPDCLIIQILRNHGQERRKTWHRPSKQEEDQEGLEQETMANLEHRTIRTSKTPTMAFTLQIEMELWIPITDGNRR